MPYMNRTRGGETPPVVIEGKNEGTKKISGNGADPAEHCQDGNPTLIRDRHIYLRR
jgi:hypothetical protein